MIRTPILRGRFSSARPFSHLVLDDFLDPALALGLAGEFPPRDEGRLRDRFGRPGKASYPDLAPLGPAFRRLDELTAGRPFLSRLEALTGIPRLLHDRDRYRGAAHEYLGWMGLRPHLDFNVLPRTGWHRRLNAVIFLTPGWRRGWGGELVLGSRAKGQAERAVEPRFNRGVIFAAGESSWHSLRPAAEPAGLAAARRLSVSLFFYSAEPPPGAERPRLTLWDFPPLPRRVRAGARLDERLWTAVEEPFLLRDLELLRGKPAGRAVLPSPLSARLRRGALLRRRDVEWLRRALARRDRALEKDWHYPERFLDAAISRLARRRAT